MSLDNPTCTWILLHVPRIPLHVPWIPIHVPWIPLQAPRIPIHVPWIPLHVPWISIHVSWVSLHVPGYRYTMNLYIRKILSSCVNFVHCNGSRSKQRILPLPRRWEHCLCYCFSQKSAYTFSSMS